MTFVTDECRCAQCQVHNKETQQLTDPAYGRPLNRIEALEWKLDLLTDRVRELFRLEKRVTELELGRIDPVKFYDPMARFD